MAIAIAAELGRRGWRSLGLEFHHRAHAPGIRAMVLLSAGLSLTGLGFLAVGVGKLVARGLGGRSAGKDERARPWRGPTTGYRRGVAPPPDPQAPP